MWANRALARAPVTRTISRSQRTAARARSAWTFSVEARVRIAGLTATRDAATDVINYVVGFAVTIVVTTRRAVALAARSADRRSGVATLLPLAPGSFELCLASLTNALESSSAKVGLWSVALPPSAEVTAAGESLPSYERYSPSQRQAQAVSNKPHAASIVDLPRIGAPCVDVLAPSTHLLECPSFHMAVPPRLRA